MLVLRLSSGNCSAASRPSARRRVARESRENLKCGAAEDDASAQGGKPALNEGGKPNGIGAGVGNIVFTSCSADSGMMNVVDASVSGRLMAMLAGGAGVMGRLMTGVLLTFTGGV